MPELICQNLLHVIVRRYVDYESLYNEMQGKLDAAEQMHRSKESELTKQLVIINEQRQEIELLRSIIYAFFFPECESFFYDIIFQFKFSSIPIESANLL